MKNNNNEECGINETTYNNNNTLFNKFKAIGPPMFPSPIKPTRLPDP
jgi:hypothetical protein